MIRTFRATERRPAPDRRTRSLLRLVREPWIVLVPLLVVQWVALLVFSQIVRHNGWLYYQGGDQTFFWTSGWVISDAHVIEAKVGYAWPYLLSPLALFLGENVVDGLPGIVLLQTLLLLPVALLAVYGIAARIGGRLIGYLAAGLWVAGPYLMIPLWDHRYHARYVEQYLPQAFGMSGLADFPSMVCLLVAAFFAVRAIDTRQVVDGALAGIATGFALGMKPSTAMFLPGVFLGLALARRWRESFAFGLALLPALLTLAVWKYKGLGHIPAITPNPKAFAAGTGPVAADFGSATDALSRYFDFNRGLYTDNLAQLREYFWSPRALQWVTIAGLIGALRASIPKGALIGGWLAVYLFVRLTSPASTLQEGTFLRLFMPGMPALVLLAATIPLLVPRFGPAIVERWPAPPFRLRWRSRPVIAGGLVFCAVPLVLVAVLSPLSTPRVAKYFDNNTIVPVEAKFAPRVTVETEGDKVYHRVSWDPPHPRGADVFFRVFRSRTVQPAPDPTLPPGHKGIRCLEKGFDFSGGAADCRVEMETIGNTRGSTWLDKTPLPPGGWTYRVGLVANWIDDTEAGDVLLISGPASYFVPRP